MDKYEFKLKADEMKALVSARNYSAAAEIAETINWRKIRNLNALVLAGEIFEQVKRYEESKEILLMAYDKSPIGRNIIYRLAEIAIKTKHFDEAQEYYDEFVDIAPHDNLKFVLKYKMTAAQGLSFQEQIQILEELKEQEYSEEWAYELAYLYHRDGQPEKCVEACDELILWFGDGIYVEKALELKMHYQPLTKLQEEKYRIFRQKRTGVIEVRPNDFLESGEIVNEPVEIPSVRTNTGQYNTANLQEEIARGIQQIASTDDTAQVPGGGESIRQLAQENPYLSVPSDNGQKSARIRKLVRMQETADLVLGEDADWRGRSGDFGEPGNFMNYGNPVLAGGSMSYADSAMPENAAGYEEPGMPGYSSNYGGPDMPGYSSDYGEADMPGYSSDYGGPDMPGRFMSYEESGEQGRFSDDEEPDVPERSMSFEEIQAEWEKTKLAMQSVLEEASEREIEPEKEKTLEEAEVLMERLLDIVSQMSVKESPDERSVQNHQVTEQNIQASEMQDGLDQAGRIVASINKLLQEQIDSLIAEEMQKQEASVHTVSDPTRELPRLPEEFVMSGQGLQAAEEMKADDEENRDVKSMENQGAVSIMEKLIAEETAKSADNPEMKPEISAIELLQRVRMESSAMDLGQKAAAGKQVMDLSQRVRADDAAADLNYESKQNPAAARQEEMPDSAGTDYYRQEEMSGNQAAGMQQRVMDGSPAAGFRQAVMEENPAVRQGVMPDSENADYYRQEEMSDGAGTDYYRQEAMPDRAETDYYRQECMPGSPAVSMQYAAPENSRADFIQQPAEGNPGMDFMQPSGNPRADFIQQPAAGSLAMGAQDRSFISSPAAEGFRQDLEEVPESEGFRQNLDKIPAADAARPVSAIDPVSYIKERTAGKPEPGYEQRMLAEHSAGIQQKGEATENLDYTAAETDIWQTAHTESSYFSKDIANQKAEQKNKQQTEEFSEEDMALAAQAAGFYKETQQTNTQDDNDLKRLTPEQKNIFSYFVPVAGMEVQIYDLLQGVSDHLRFDKNAVTGNIIVEGIGGNGKTVLIMDIIKVLQKEIKRPNGKIGKIDANALNQKDMDVLTEKVSGGCLIIESAGKITRETAVKLSRCMEQDHVGTLYILEDTEEGIQKALARDSSFAARFTEKISIPLFSVDELVAFGKAYANDLNYDIDEMGILALYKRIGNIQKLDHVTTLTEVKEIVDEAIDNAEKGVFKKVFGILTSTRANDDNYVILREKDFEE